MCMCTCNIYIYIYIYIYICIFGLNTVARLRGFYSLFPPHKQVAPMRFCRILQRSWCYSYRRTGQDMLRFGPFDIGRARCFGIDTASILQGPKHASVRSFRYRQGSVFRYRYGFDPSYIYIYTHIDTYHKYIYIYIHINIHINLSLSIHIYIYIYIHRSSRPQPFAGPHLWSLTLESHTPSPPTPGLR